MNSGDMIELLESLLPFVWFAQANNVPNAAHYAELLDGMICNPAPSSLPQEDDRELVERLRESAKAYACMLHDGHAADCRAAADRLLQLSRDVDLLRKENAALKHDLERMMERKNRYLNILVSSGISEQGEM